MKNLKYILVTALFFFAIGSYIGSILSGNVRDLKKEKGILEFQHTRDSLVIDSLKSQNAIGGWYESQWSKETGD